MAVDPLPVSLVVVVSILVGVGLGVLVERLFGGAARRAAKFEADLVQARSDLMRYQEQTKQHFGKSAELLGRMATDYREFLHHFVRGAEDLCGPNMRELNATLERPLLDGAASAKTAAAPAASAAASAPPIPATASTAATPPIPATTSKTAGAPLPPTVAAPAVKPPIERPAYATTATASPLPPVLDQEPLAEDAMR